MNAAYDCHFGVVHPWLCDAMGHFTTRHYYAMFDDASYALLAMLGYDPETLGHSIGFADVKHTATFKSELKVGDIVQISGEVSRLGRSSIDMKFAMRNIRTGTVAAELVTTTVQFDLVTRGPTSILPEIRENAKARFLGTVIRE